MDKRDGSQTVKSHCWPKAVPTDGTASEPATKATVDYQRLCDVTRAQPFMACYLHFGPAVVSRHHYCPSNSFGKAVTIMIKFI